MVAGRRVFGFAPGRSTAGLIPLCEKGIGSGAVAHPEHNMRLFENVIIYIYVESERVMCCDPVNMCT